MVEHPLTIGSLQDIARTLAWLRTIERPTGIVVSFRQLICERCGQPATITHGETSIFCCENVQERLGDLMAKKWQRDNERGFGPLPVKAKATHLFGTPLTTRLNCRPPYPILRATESLDELDLSRVKDGEHVTVDNTLGPVTRHKLTNAYVFFKGLIASLRGRREFADAVQQGHRAMAELESVIKLD